MYYCKFCEFFTNTFFRRTAPVADSVIQLINYALTVGLLSGMYVTWNTDL